MKTKGHATLNKQQQQDRKMKMNRFYAALSLWMDSKSTPFKGVL